MNQEPKKTELIGKSPAIKEVRELCRKAATGDYSVLVRGPSGVGKELVARMISELSSYSSKFVPVNCSAIPENLIESILFGHEKGAFTDARQRRAGKFELAAGGVLFLDEVADLSLAAQAKVLRALQEKEIERVGGETPVRIDVKVVSATNRNIEQMISEGKFREDLFYRLNVVTVHVLPLRERLSDVPVLAGHFLGRHGIRKTLSREAIRKLKEWSWPGNVRELENVIRRADALSSDNKIGAKDIIFDHIVQCDYPKAGDIENVEDKIRSVIEMNGCAANREIRNATGLSKASVQRHVRALRQAGRIEVRLNGRGTLYVLAEKDESGNGKGALNVRRNRLQTILKETGVITKSAYMEKFNVSERTASRDLRKMCELGFIRRDGRGCATIYTLS